MRKWIAEMLCNWTHAGGHVTRDGQRRINWQCSTCGRWSTPVPLFEERRMIDRDLADYQNRRRTPSGCGPIGETE